MADFITINSGRARVIVTVEDDSFVTLITEDATQHTFLLTFQRNTVL